jgi:hypothetical protein
MGISKCKPHRCIVAKWKAKKANRITAVTRYDQ